MIAHASPFKGIGTPVQGCSRGSATATLRSITTGAISRSFISLWKAATWGKPTARPLWGSGSVHGKRRPCDSMIEQKRRLRRRVTRLREQGRQCDRQREEIHPAQVLSELEARLPPPPASVQLPAAKP